MLSYLWGGKKTDDSKPENENPELAMREAMDAHGEFGTEMDGTLRFQDFLVFRAIITRQAGRLFAPKREELNARKLQAFKDRNQQEYVNVFREGQVEYQKAMVTISKKACEWIELDGQNYQLSIRQYMEDENKRKEVQDKDQEVRMALETKPVD